MTKPKAGYNSGINRNVTGTIDSEGVFTSGGESSGFKASSYTGKITSTEDGTAFVMATGARTLSLESFELTSITEFAVIAFGESAAAAQANLDKSGTTPNIISEAGLTIRSGDSTLGIAPQSRVVGIPANAQDGGYAALGNGAAADDQIIMVTQGVGGI